MNNKGKTKGQPRNKNQFANKITKEDLQWVRDNADADIMFLEYELKKRIVSRGFSVTPRTGEYIYKKIEEALRA